MYTSLSFCCFDSADKFGFLQLPAVTYSTLFHLISAQEGINISEPGELEA